MTPAPRLDYSKTPPGYSTWTYKGATLYQAPNGEQIGPRSAAWAHYKTSNDPPGLDVMDDALVGWGFQVLRMRTWPTPGTRPVREFHIIDGGQQPARTAAWAWYDRRLALFALSDAAEGLRGTATASTAWPRCLTWSDDQVSEVERWLVDSTAEIPEVLRG